MNEDPRARLSNIDQESEESTVTPIYVWREVNNKHFLPAGFCQVLATSLPSSRGQDAARHRSAGSDVGMREWSGGARGRYRRYAVPPGITRPPNTDACGGAHASWPLPLRDARLDALSSSWNEIFSPWVGS